MTQNLRHLRVFLAAVDLGSITRASEVCHISQPAITQAISKLEAKLGTALFSRSAARMFVSPAGEMLAERVRRALALLDPALEDLSPRLKLTATTARLHALIALCEMENFTLAARRIGVAQPTVHRAVNQLEQDADRPLFRRTSSGIHPTRPARALAQAARLFFVELEQAEAELGELLGKETGQIRVGALPLSRSFLLPSTIARFGRIRPGTVIRVIEGPYADLLVSLRSGRLDMIIGALRHPVPIEDAEQHPLFHDTLALLARPGHPILDLPAPGLEDLLRYPWVTSHPGTPSRIAFDKLFDGLPATLPRPVCSVETGSVILMREVLRSGDHLGCISFLQARAELDLGLMARVPFDMAGTSRPIGLTLRAGWRPTGNQRLFLEMLGLQSEL